MYIPWSEEFEVLSGMLKEHPDLTVRQKETILRCMKLVQDYQMKRRKQYENRITRTKDDFEPAAVARKVGRPRKDPLLVPKELIIPYSCQIRILSDATKIIVDSDRAVLEVYDTPIALLNKQGRMFVLDEEYRIIKFKRSEDKGKGNILFRKNIQAFLQYNDAKIVGRVVSRTREELAIGRQLLKDDVPEIKRFSGRDSRAFYQCDSVPDRKEPAEIDGF